MSFKVLFPGNNKIGEVDVRKLDPKDKIMGEFQGLVDCVDLDGKKVPGILLSDLEGCSSDMVEVLSSDIKSMKILVMSSVDINNKSVRNICVNISIDNEESKVVEMLFNVTKSSLDKYEGLASEAGKSWFILKSPDIVFLAQFEIVSGSICFKELELLH